jgi:hypoxanthine phosphoribosyltransferase
MRAMAVALRGKAAKETLHIQKEKQKENSTMDTVAIKDKRFRISIPESEIKQRVSEVAKRINHDMAGKNPIFLAVLNGSFIFAADLLREIDLPCEISFIKLASYQGTSTTGSIREVIGLNFDITDRPVIIVEDIIDTGLTMAYMLDTLKGHKPASIDICTLLLKPTKLQVKLDVRYCCKEIPDDFVVGFGLDYDGFGRNTKDIYTII